MTNLLNALISPAWADTAAAPSDAGSPLSMIFMFGFLFLFFYFAMWRPQSKRAKQQRELINSLTKGDEVITTGGVLGKINKIMDHYVALAVHHNSEMIVQKSAIMSALPKGTLKTLES